MTTIEALLALENEKGQLLPQDVVNAARDPGSPLHRHFEWDDRKAGEAYRLNQARRLIRVTVEVQVPGHSEALRISAYTRDPERSTREAGYVSTRELMRDDADIRRDALLAEFERASAILRRARRYAIALGFESEHAGLERNLRDLRNKVADVHADALA